MSVLADIEAAAAASHLTVLGCFHPTDADKLPPDMQTIFLLGPAEPGFWEHVTASTEWQDGQPDPMDRWSNRTIGQIAKEFSGKALFPFGAPPYHPFYQWAIRSGRAWASPASLLVHDNAGLLVSYRGAIALSQKMILPEQTGVSPCKTCVEMPCLRACPAGAVASNGYDVPACHRFLDTEGGNECLSLGCGVRRACPVSHGYGRLHEQSSYHMRLFHP